MGVPEDQETGAAEPSVPAQNPTQNPTRDSTQDPASDIDEKEQQRPAAEDTKDEARSKTVPSSRFTGHQLFYIFGLDGIGALIISGGINFAIAYAMYTRQSKPIRLWQLPNTFAGDAAVTIIIQCIITWFVELFILRYDLSQGAVQPIGFISQPTHPWLRFFFFLPKDPNAEIERKPRPWSLLEIIQQALRGFSFAVVSFFILWPIFMGALTAFGVKEGGDYYYHNKWVPQVFKLILGGVLGLLVTPWMAMFWLVKAGWEHRGEDSTTAEV
ncbi:hypothetical protein T069G_04352 [Trichoderma breve]|uniref:Uncharacterized protein n=1 Tax=Trichoderma breve TaxID=2034170 RepID=A0A9W9JPJ3_9HYPO|nr:hypothetical protein T069G_04352 [Trichoderma breve]KAJ4863398.1 hypothetical protein T069G_04352 [Trichoderma breve]